MFSCLDTLPIQLENRRLEKIAVSGGRVSQPVRLFNLRPLRLKLWRRPASLMLQLKLK